MRIMPGDTSLSSIPQLKRLEMYDAAATLKNPVPFHVAGHIQAADMCNSVLVGPQLEITASTYHELECDELFNSQDRTLALDIELYRQQKLLLLVRETEFDAHLGPVKAHFALMPSGEGKLLLSQIATHEMLRTRTPPSTVVSMEAQEQMKSDLEKVPAIGAFNPSALSSNVLPHLVAKSKSNKSGSGGGSSSSSSAQKKVASKSKSANRRQRNSSSSSPSSPASSSASAPAATTSTGKSSRSNNRGSKKRPAGGDAGSKKRSKAKPISSPALSSLLRTPSPLGQHMRNAAGQC